MNMRPDRSNYEIWFTDWLDGNLSEKQVGELKVFLKENPDLEEELNGLALVFLNPPHSIFGGKKELEQSPESLSESQFEHLCIASLENDLTPGHKAELDEILGRDETKRKSFELIQKLKLKPLTGSFARKNRIKKLTVSQKIYRLSVIGLSAAATIALLISLFLLIPENSGRGTLRITQNITPDTLVIESREAFTYKEEEPAIDSRSTKAFVRKSIPEIPAGELIVPLAELPDQEMTDSASQFQRAESLEMMKIAVPENIFTAYMPESNAVLPFDPGYVPPLIDYRSNVQLFLARLFHEKIMKNPNAGTRPVESFEIAQAGITGLNKLFGWEIALHKSTDTNGEIRSYNYSSRLLKFNAPVKKSQKAL